MSRAPGINITGGGFGAMVARDDFGQALLGITITNPGSGYTSTPSVYIGYFREVSMVPAAPNGFIPGLAKGWDSGVPDPGHVGPPVYPDRHEGGILPGVAVRANQPVNFDYDRGSTTFGNVQNIEGVDPAIKGVTVSFSDRRSVPDVIVAPPGWRLALSVILYNDAPAPVPGFQPRYDYYTRATPI